MRLPYTPHPPPLSTHPADPITAALLARRAPRPLQPLDLTLLHSPPVALGWNSFLGAIRTETTLAADIREIAICRVAVLNGAAYEWAHHAVLMEGAGVGGRARGSVLGVRVGGWGVREEGGEGEEGVEGDGEGVEEGGREGKGEGKGEGDGDGKGGWGLDERQVAVLRYTDAMTVGCRVPDEVFAELKRLFSDKEVVEITATVAAYNCVSRFLVALDVGEMNGKEVGRQEGEEVEGEASGH